MSTPHRLAVLASGRGSNLATIAAACSDGRVDGEMALVLSNVPGSGALQIAGDLGVPSHCIAHGDYASREAFEEAMLTVLQAARIDFIALAGFMRILTPRFIREYCGSLLNIHPSLLPKYPGLDTHRRALEAGDRESGATVHFVIPELDAGPAIVQGRVPVEPGDDVQRLASRVLEIEHRIYPQALAWCLSGDVSLRDGAAWKNGVQLVEGGIDYSHTLDAPV